MAREFKDSCIEWIGQIPKEWKVELIGNNIKEINDKNDDSSEDNALQFKMGTIISKKGGDSKYNPESLVAYTKVKEGDIVINGLNLSFDFISQRVGLVREKGVITSTYLTLRPSSLLYSRFVNYLFKAYDNCKAFHGMGRGLRQILAYRELKNQKLIYPALPEQQKIADYLDKVCGEVDEMVALQEKMIEELKAYKQSVITEAVTKGLNPNAPMKDSGIDWIGEIPEGWSTIKIRYLKSGLTDGTHGTYARATNGHYLLSSKNVRDNDLFIGTNESFISEEDYKEIISNGFPNKGDVLLCCIGASIGRCIVYQLDESYAFQRSVIFIRCNNLIKPYFLRYSLLSSSTIIQENLLINQSAQAGLYQAQVKEITIPVSSIDEQQQITSYLDTKCSEIDSLIAIKQQKIEELKEYKKSIIYEYVTGKKEVA